MAKGEAVLRRRRAQWSGLWPSWNRTGLWPQLRCAWWTWDYIPAPASISVGTVVDDLRGTPGDRLEDDA